MTSENYNEFVCSELRACDPDLFLVSLFAPRNRREALWSLFLFNHEISKTRYIVTETQLGLIRLQWWREELDKLYKGAYAPSNPVLEGLEVAIRDYALPKALFDNLLYAREFDLEGVSPQGLKGLIHYADLTTTPLNKLALQIAGDDPAEECLLEVSTRFCLSRLYRAIPHHKAYNFILIEEGMQDEVIDYLTSVLNKSFKPHSSLLKAQHVLTKIYLKQLKSVHFDPHDPKMNRPPWFKELRVFMGAL